MVGKFAERCRLELGGGVVVTDEGRLGEYRVDGMVPEVVLTPETTDEAATILRLASEMRVPVLIRGSGTKMSIGLPLNQCPSVLSTERMRAVANLEAKNFTVTIQGGMPLDVFQTYLAGENMFFPHDPPYPRSTVGGNVASKTIGPRRLMYGSLRDMVLGVKVVLATGDVVQFGGMVMKNVAGYDMSKFFVGTLGTVGLVAEATLKLHVVPECRETVAAWFENSAAALKVSHALKASHLEPSRMMVLDRRAHALAVGGASAYAGGEAYLLVSFEGIREAVRREVRDGLEMCREAEGRGETSFSDEAIWEGIRELHQQFARADGQAMVCRLSIPLARLEPVLKGLEGFSGAGGAPAAVLCDSGCGMVYFFSPGTEASRQVSVVECLQRLARANDGFLQIELGPAAIRRSAGYLATTSPTTSIMRQLQRRFDPQGILHPEKLFGPS